MGDATLPVDDPRLGTLLGRYRLVRMIGQGGMGVVYEAVHLDLGRRAAIKTLHDRYARDADVRQRFLREGQAASRVLHPNIVDVYDVGIEGECPYLVMELLEGADLATHLRDNGLLQAESASDLLLPVVSALCAAHDLDIVHRDLKPENVFLSTERSRIVPKVLDFGISKLVNRDEAESLTGTGAFIGTPHYMSPEQAQGAKRLDHRSDQYSLGVILYRCVTGRKPVEEPSLYPLIQRIVRGDFPRPRELNAELPIEFEELILRAMARDPNARFPNTAALGSALLPFASTRIRSQYAPEFAADPLAQTAASPVHTTGKASARDGSAPLETTQGASLPPRRTKSLRRRRIGLAALTTLAVCGVLAYQWLAETPPSKSVSSGIPSSEAQAPVPAVDSVPPASLAPPTPSTAPAASGEPDPAPARMEKPAPASSRRKPTATRVPDRPSLAPR